MTRCSPGVTSLRSLFPRGRDGGGRSRRRQVRLPGLFSPEAAETGSSSLVSLSPCKSGAKEKNKNKNQDLWIDLWVTVFKAGYIRTTCAGSWSHLFPLLCFPSCCLIVPLVFFARLDERIAALTCIQMSPALQKKKTTRCLAERLLRSIQV